MPDRTARDATRVERDVQDPARRVTTVRPGRTTPEPGPNPPKVVAKGVDNRWIVGVLLTYSWVPEGKLYEVREGRTHIGSGKIKDDPQRRDVEVQCPLDQMLSGDHALILMQRDKCYIQDLASTNGTYVNGKLLRPETIEDLPNEAEIKVGKTTFTFVRFKPVSETETPTIRAEVEEERPASRRGETKFEWPSS